MVIPKTLTREVSVDRGQMRIYFNILCTFYSMLFGVIFANDETSPQTTFVDIPAGKFVMGSHDNEEGRWGDERRHWVTLTNNIQMQATEVTQRQYFEVMGTNPSYFKWNYHCPDDYGVVGKTRMCPNHPVENVSWFDVQRYIAKLNARGDGYLYRLPTEAEWEYGARAGTESYFSFGPYITPGQANYHGQAEYKYAIKGVYRGRPVAVASFDANAYGLYDMHGNVREWVFDAYGDYYMGQDPRLRRGPLGALSGMASGLRNTIQRTDPQGAQVGPGRVIRGGGWNSSPFALRSAFRDYAPANERQSDIGFRPVRVSLNPVVFSEESEAQGQHPEDSEEFEAGEAPEEEQEESEESGE